MLIREVPDDVLRVIDANARRLGLSRTAYLRRQLAGEARGGPMSTADPPPSVSSWRISVTTM